MITTTFLRWFGMPGVVFVAMLGFYEGVPLVRTIPLIDRVDVIGPLLTGRVERERRIARLERDRYWLQRARDAEHELERERVERARRIAAITRKALEAEEQASAREDARRLELQRTLRRLTDRTPPVTPTVSGAPTNDTINTNPAPTPPPEQDPAHVAPACNCLNQRIPADILRVIR